MDTVDKAYASEKMSRTKKRLIKLALVAVLLIAYGAYVYYQNNNLISVHYSISSERIDNDLSIVHLSDLHGKQFGRANHVLRAEIESATPDLIVFTGDMIDAYNSKYLPTVQFLGELTEIAPVVGVLGNHERGSGMRHDFRNRLLAEGVHVLDNQFLSLEVTGNELTLLGFDENIEVRISNNVHAPLLAELEDSPHFRIVLSHYAHEFAQIDDYSFENYDFDLMFAGHTHGGQWNLPWMGALYVPDQSFPPKHTRGLYDERLVVSAGLGSRLIPARWFNYPEVVIVSVEPIDNR